MSLGRYEVIEEDKGRRTRRAKEQGHNINKGGYEEEGGILFMRV